MKVLISAGETSADVHGARLLSALREQAAGEAVEAFGIGGPELQQSGLEAVVDTRSLMVAGFSEILSSLPRLYRHLSQISAAASSRRPDIAILIDYPDFHMRFARRLKRLGIPVIYYIPPKIWVWRKGRLKTIRKVFDQVLCIFPFEEKIYREASIPAKYVGNPLVDELPLGLSRDDARGRLGLAEQDLMLVLMPGSRRSELEGHAELMISAAALVAERLRSRGVLGPDEKLKVRIPLSSTSDSGSERVRFEPFIRKYERVIDVALSFKDAAVCLIAANAGLIKSGTSTLEAGLLGCPHVVVYKPTQLTAWIFKNLICYRGPVGMVNLAAGWRPGDPYLVKEILAEEATVERLAEEALSLLTDASKRALLARGFEKLRESLVRDSAPSELAAKEVWSTLRKTRGEA